MSALEVQGLGRVYGALRAVDDVSLTVESGERYAIIGPNGAGKTTLFNLIAGDVTSTSGRVLLQGRDVTRLSNHARCRLGLARTFQRNNLFLGLTVAENIALAVRRRLGLAADPFRPARLQRRVVDETANLLAQLGLADRAEALARDLSYGEQRQLEIALALGAGPSVLLLDEPTAGMSPAETTHMAALIQDLPRTITVLIIEHDMDVVFTLADRITVLQFGRVLATGTPAAVRADAAVQEAYLGAAAEAAYLGVVPGPPHEAVRTG